MSYFSRAAATDARLLKRSTESLLGICTGVLADGVLTDDEITFLDNWLANNDEIAHTWPGEVIYKRIRAALEDGRIDEDERAHLADTLAALIGGELEDSGAAGGLSTTLPLDHVDAIILPGKQFCFTGEFLFGTRAACHKATEKEGGIPAKGITKKLDYLVIGTLASREWAHTTHGRKIEKAVAYKESGVPLSIIDEESWIQAIS